MKTVWYTITVMHSPYDQTVVWDDYTTPTDMGIKARAAYDQYKTRVLVHRQKNNRSRLGKLVMEIEQGGGAMYHELGG